MSTPDPGIQFALLKVSEMAERLALAEATMGGLIDGVSDVRELVEEHQKLLEKTSAILANLTPPDDDGPEEPPYVIQPMTSLVDRRRRRPPPGRRPHPGLG